jgi:serine/threonine protein kinase
MSPELVQIAHFWKSGESYTNAVDWWALGMTLFELALGKVTNFCFCNTLDYMYVVVLV